MFSAKPATPVEGLQLVPMGTNGKNKPYSELGKVLDVLARERDVRGPYNIAQHLEDVIGYEVSGQAVSKYLYGVYIPNRGFIKAFVEVLELSHRERMELAWVYTYGSRLDVANTGGY
jgi:hypothetical protein